MWIGQAGLTLTDWAANGYRPRWFVKANACHFSFMDFIDLPALKPKRAMFNSFKHGFAATSSQCLRWHVLTKESIHLWRPLRLSTSTRAQREGWSPSHCRHIHIHLVYQVLYQWDFTSKLAEKWLSFAKYWVHTDQTWHVVDRIHR